MHHMVARENFGKTLDFEVKKTPKPKHQTLQFDEGVNFDSSIESSSFTGHKDDSNMHNYALMIFDKKKQGFRLVPVDSHIEFEKKKIKNSGKYIIKINSISG